MHIDISMFFCYIIGSPIPILLSSDTYLFIEICSKMRFAVLCAMMTRFLNELEVSPAGIVE